MKSFSLILSLLFLSAGIATQDITPYKFTDEEWETNKPPQYSIPPSCRFTTKRTDPQAPEIVYYVSKPKNTSFPIAILCGGSSSQDFITSIIHFHRYFLQEFLELGVAVLTVEQQGVDGPHINSQEFMQHYTQSNRLTDHRLVIKNLQQHPPIGWNGKLIFLGVSEGGPLVTTLTAEYGDMTLATMNWSGAGDFSWQDELWDFLQDLSQKMPWSMHVRAYLPSWMPFSLDAAWSMSRQDFDAVLAKIVNNPTPNAEFLGMTYAYHADALKTYPTLQYDHLKTPFLVVAGQKDSRISSSDAFVERAKKAGVPVTYLRIAEMDHYVRKRKDVLEKSFQWLKSHLPSDLS